jgi:hypothetical protein
MEDTRRSVLKRACFCGISACGVAAGACSQAVANETPKPQPAPRDPMPYKWISALLPSIDANTDREHARTIMKGCAQSHFDHLEMGKTLARFTGKLDDFLAFLKGEWGWIIEHRKEEGIILIDENKAVCVCPLIQKDIAMKSGSLCYCSEGFAERMFSLVVGRARPGRGAGIHPARSQELQVQNLTDDAGDEAGTA